MEQLAPLNLGNLALKCKSKKEMYDVLLNDCGVYLPPIEYANASYIRNIMTGKVDVRLIEKLLNNLVHKDF